MGCLLFTGSCVAHVYVWRCQRACPEKAADAPADVSSIRMTAATNVGTAAITPTTATASASEEEEEEEAAVAGD